LKILFIHNDYFEPSGEEHAVEGLAALLEANGHQVIWYRRGSREMDEMKFGKLRAAFSSLYNPKAVKDIELIIRKECPDVVQVQSVYPFISPRILKMIKKHSLPLVMRCPNYRLWCPTGLFLDRSGEICEKCTGPAGELSCIKNNCTGSALKSTAYALRNFVARKSGVFAKYVDTFIVQSEFQREKFASLGIPKEKTVIVPGLTPPMLPSTTRFEAKYYTFIGRVSKEKGVEDIFRAASALPNLTFAIAGRVGDMFDISGAPANVIFKGFLSGLELDDLYRESKAILVPSRWYEGFPNVITKAMYHGKPVITSNMGCFNDIVSHGKTGLMFDINNSGGLKEAILQIENDPVKAKQMGEEGKLVSQKKYGDDRIYNKLIEIYN
tara:strand:- start:61514 stop:62659 length:1146 start_codon:yes stop_codon:yes gene_type:complete